MRDKKSKLSRSSINKKKRKDSENDTVSEGFEENSALENVDNEEKSPKKQARDIRKSGRKVDRKSLAEFFDNKEEEDEDEDDEPLNKSVRRGSEKKSVSKGGRSKRSKNNEDEANGEKVQITKKDQRKSSRISGVEASENEDQKESDEKEEIEEEEEDDEEETLSKMSRNSSKRKSSTKGSDSKRSRTNDNVEESDEGTEESENPKKSDSKKRKSNVQKNKTNNESDDEDEDEDMQEYEVEKLVDVYFKKNGDKEFLVRWKGYSSKDDTWEPEKHLNCKELIDAYMEKCEKARNAPLREMRINRRRTDRYIVNQEMRGRKLSARLKQKPRKAYHEMA